MGTMVKVQSPILKVQSPSPKDQSSKFKEMIAYLLVHPWLVWLAIAIVCLILEITSGDFYVTCFAIGAVAAIIPAGIALPLWVQILVWAIASVLSIYFIRPYLLRKIHPKSRQRKSNADALIDRIGLVTDAIAPNGYGYVKIDGDSWRSHTADGSAVDAGTHVKVVARDSIILTVEKVKNEE